MKVNIRRQWNDGELLK